MPRTNLVFFHGMGVQDPGYHQAVWDFLVEKHQAIAGSDQTARLKVWGLFADRGKPRPQTGCHPFQQRAGEVSGGEILR